MIVETSRCGKTGPGNPLPQSHRLCSPRMSPPWWTLQSTLERFPLQPRTLGFVHFWNLSPKSHATLELGAPLSGRSFLISASLKLSIQGLLPPGTTSGMEISPPLMTPLAPRLFLSPASSLRLSTSQPGARCWAEGRRDGLDVVGKFCGSYFSFPIKTAFI